MQWDGTRNAGFSTAPADRLYAPLIAGGEFDYERINVQIAEGDPASLLNWIRMALRVRRDHPAFGRGSLSLVTSVTSSVLAYLREYEGETLLVLNNLSGQGVSLRIQLPGSQQRRVLNLFGSHQGRGTDTDLSDVELEPYGFRWFRVN